MSNQDFNPESTYQEAMQAYQRGQIRTAEDKLKEILQHLPDQDGVMGSLGGILIAGGKLQEGVAVLEKAKEINPNNIDAQLNLGIAYQSMGRMEESFKMMDQAAALAPDRADVQYNMANFLLQTQQYPKAIAKLRQVLDLDPNLMQAYYTLASVHGYLQEHTEAIETYEQALLRSPNDMSALIQLANLLADIGQTERAEKTYLQAVEVYPEHFITHAVLGKFLLDIGKNKEGEAALLKAYDLNPNDLNTNILLGNVSKDLGRVAEAEEYYRSALEIDPEDQGALRNLRRILSAKIPFWHFEMLADTERNDAYQKAIEKVITKDSVVLDIGTGSGLLSMMAARAGAKQVVACEMHERLAATAKKITEKNGFGEIITVHEMKSTKLKVGKEVPHKVDVIISEILDVGALGEAALPSIRHAVQNLAKPEVKLIPARVHLFGQVIEIPARSMVAPIREISGFDLSLFEEYRIPNEYIKVNLKAEKYQPLSDVIPLMEIDFYDLPAAYPDDQPREIPLSIPIATTGNAQAIVFWFDLYLDDDIVVSSRLDGELEHWGQALFCFDTPPAVNAGEELAVTLLQSDQIIRFELKKN